MNNNRGRFIALLLFVPMFSVHLYIPNLVCQTSANLHDGFVSNFSRWLGQHVKIIIQEKFFRIPISGRVICPFLLLWQMPNCGGISVQQTSIVSKSPFRPVAALFRESSYWPCWLKAEFFSLNWVYLQIVYCQKRWIVNPNTILAHSQWDLVVQRRVLCECTCTLSWRWIGSWNQHPLTVWIHCSTVDVWWKCHVKLFFCGQKIPGGSKILL